MYTWLSSQGALGKSQLPPQEPQHHVYRKCSINVKPQIPLSISDLIYQVLAYLSSLPVLICSISISLAPIIVLESQHPHSSWTPVPSWKVRQTLLSPQTPFQSLSIARSLKQGSIFQGKLRDIVRARLC